MSWKIYLICTTLFISMIISGNLGYPSLYKVLFLSLFFIIFFNSVYSFTFFLKKSKETYKKWKDSKNSKKN